MKKLYTPGPWSISYQPDGKVAFINKGRVASVELDDNEHGEGNSKLIASAPDLLEALEGLSDILSNRYGDDPSETPLIDKAFRAIYKANGLWHNQ